MYPELYKFDQIEAMNNLEVANFGTGMGYYDFCYDNLEVQAFNFALTQQSLEFDYKLMEHYQNKFKKGCYICLVLPFFIFCAHDLEDVRGRYERYYSLLPQSQVRDRCLTTYEDYMYRSKQQSIIGRQEELVLERCLGEAEMREQIKAALENWIKSLKIVSFQSGALSEHVQSEMIQTKFWFGKILDFCKKKEYRPVIVVPPLCQDLLKEISWKFRQTHFFNILEEYLNNDIVVLDYTAIGGYCAHNLYGWPGFLIKSAAVDFTKDVLRRLNVIKD